LGAKIQGIDPSTHAAWKGIVSPLNASLIHKERAILGILFHWNREYHNPIYVQAASLLISRFNITSGGPCANCMIAAGLGAKLPNC
jgi:hypothetical protein